MAFSSACITLKHAQLPDLADAQQLLAEYYNAIGVLHRDSSEQIQSFLSNPLSGMWLAYAGDVVAGCIVLRPLPNVPGASECKRLYVRPSFRGNGIAGRLLDALELHACRLGSEWVYLDSKDDLQDALRFYRGRGYESCERYNDNRQATVFLRKRVLTHEERPSS